MADINNISSLSTADLLNNSTQKKQNTSNGGLDFEKHLKSALNEVNTMQKEKEEAMADLATGQVKDLHQAAMAIGKAETSMKLMLEIRNKALSAYKEISRTQL